MLEAESIVTAVIGTTVVRCLVVSVDDQETVLVPLTSTPDLEAVLSDPPGSLALSTGDGKTIELSLTRVGTVPCIRAEAASYPDQDSGRQHYRVRTEFRAEVSLGSGASWYACLGEDISEGGMLLANQNRADITLGQQVGFCVHLPGSGDIYGVGLVARATGAGDAPTPKQFAVQFTSMTATDSRMLVRFLYEQQIRNAPVIRDSVT